MPYHDEPLKKQLGQALGATRDAIYEPLAELSVTAWVTREPRRPM